MRFGVPRSDTPPPSRFRTPRGSSTFGLYTDSSDDDDEVAVDEVDDEDEYDFAAVSSSSDSSVGGNAFGGRDGGEESDDSLLFVVKGKGKEKEKEKKGETAVKLTAKLTAKTRPKSQPKPPLASSIKRNAEELREIEDTISAIRLRARHHDPYDEWEKRARRDAFRTARKQQQQQQLALHTSQTQARTAELDKLAARHARELQDVQAQLSALKLKQQADEERLQTAWRARDKQLWEHIEDVIQCEEEKVRRKIEEENRAREEAERKRAEERRKQEEEERKMKEEEERRKQEEERAREEEKVRMEKALEVQMREEMEKLASERRVKLGLTMPVDDWATGRRILQGLKQGPMLTVKSNKELKSIWNNLRRQITPKVGQLTNDPAAIRRITEQIYGILQPAHAHPEPLYYALLSSLAKAILLQAETEVTATTKSAIPLSLVTAQLLQRLPSFCDIFWAKLVQRAGGWPVPTVIPIDRDWNDEPWENVGQKRRAMGYRDGETEGDYLSRVAGMMRVYFLILWAPVGNDEQSPPMPKMYQTPKFWTWFSRALGAGGKDLFASPVAAEVIFVALDVGGKYAKAAWGQQWDKLLRLLVQGVKEGLNLAGKTMVVGGELPEGKAARVRVELEIEKVLGV